MDRKVRVAAFTHKARGGEPSVERNLRWSAEIIDKIAAEGPDVIALTENFNTRQVSAARPERAEAGDGPTLAMLCEKAAQHRCYLIGSLLETREGRVYNAAVVIDRDGRIAGRYDKMHPTNYEMDDGVAPGRTEPTVIETDFGKIGCQICFDANWPLDWHALAEAGAEIIFFPSAYSGGRTLASIATLFNVPIVAANAPTCCQIIDCDGTVLTRQGVYRDWVIETLNLDSPLFHLDYQWEKLERLRVKYGKVVKVHVYEEEGWWRIYPQDDAVSVRELVREFGLVTHKEYIAESTAQQQRTRMAQSGAVGEG